MIDAEDKRGELLKHRRKSFLDALMLLAGPPNQGNNLRLAERHITEFLKPIASDTAVLRSELELMRGTIISKMDNDRGSSKFFQGVLDFIEANLRAAR
jgi:hypothetical protein